MVSNPVVGFRSAACIRAHTSKSWLNRHVNDHFVQEAQKHDLRARSAFKLQEMQEKHKFIKAHHIVVDLGAAPGGWSVVVSKLLDVSKGGRVVAVDLLPMEPVPHTIVIQGDFTSVIVQQQLRDSLGGKKANVIVSDMLQNTTGQHDRDHFRSIELCMQALDFCKEQLESKGSFLCKYLRGSDEKELIDYARQIFRVVKTIKPKSSRSESREMYLLCLDKSD
jgi:23S rRNA (uridine2552-2'-O)-methyltransferase